MLTKTIKVEAKHYGQKWVILGKQGSGKSYTARVAIEEARDLGVCVAVVDPQDAYGNLPGFDYVHAKKVSNPEGFGILIARTGKCVVMRTKGLTITEQQIFVKKFLIGFRKSLGRGIRLIVMDEAHKFAPESEKAESKGETRSMSQENRSDGLGFIAVEQRPQRLDKTVLSQADIVVIHKLTAYRDLKAIEPYLDDPNALEEIKKLNKGQAYIAGFSDDPLIEQVRTANTEHTGDSPENLITEDSGSYQRNLKRVYKGGSSMSDPIPASATSNELVSGVVPSLGGFMDLVAAGAKVSLGLGLSGLVGAFASRLPLRLPVVSNRTLGSALTTIVLYAGHRMASGHETLKSILGYATAGAAVHTAGSLVFDLLATFKIPVPGVVNFAVQTMTGASPLVVEGPMSAPTGGSSEVDVSTRFA